MTEERKQYLASISKEERAIREGISYHKDLIKSLKDIFNCDDGVVKNSWKFAIAKEKTVIQSLKKQLPAPTRFGSCVICGSKQPKGHIRFYSYSYCAECGQKLR